MVTNHIGADDAGVWRVDGDGPRSVLQWDELEAVHVGRLDVIREVLTVVELAHPSGHWLEWHSDMDGFEAATAVLAGRLRLEPGWLTREGTAWTRPAKR